MVAWVIAARTAVLSVITGGGKWVEIKLHADPLYQHLLLTAERKFWRCPAPVRSGASQTPPEGRPCGGYERGGCGAVQKSKLTLFEYCVLGNTTGTSGTRQLPRSCLA
jgi:hypothetical protein